MSFVWLYPAWEWIRFFLNFDLPTLVRTKLQDVQWILNDRSDALVLRGLVADLVNDAMVAFICVPWLKCACSLHRHIRHYQIKIRTDAECLRRFIKISDLVHFLFRFEALVSELNLRAGLNKIFAHNHFVTINKVPFLGLELRRIYWVFVFPLANKELVCCVLTTCFSLSSCALR